MNVRFTDRGHSRFPPPQGVKFIVERYRWEAQGGPKWAQIRVEGDTADLGQLFTWLRYGVLIRNKVGTPVFWGYVATVNLGATSVSLDDMYNRVAVIWSNENGGGVTAWAEDADSVSVYGTKELLLPVDGIGETEAEYRRDWELGQRKWPRAAWRPDAAGGGSLFCRGWADTLAWTRYDRDEGLAEYAVSGGVGQKVGWGFSSQPTVGFTSRIRDVSEMYNRFNTLDKGEKFRVTGSASNNSTFTVESSSTRERQTLTATSIAFLQQERSANDYTRATVVAGDTVPRTLSNPNIKAGTVVVTNDDGSVTYTESGATPDYTIDYTNGTITSLDAGSIVDNQVLRVSYDYTENRIEHSNLGLGFCNAGDVIGVSGATNAGNNRYYRVLSGSNDGDRITVKESVTDEGPGASITISRGSNVSVEEAMVDELPANNVTVHAYGYAVAQSFQSVSDAAWTVNQIQVRVRKVGSPSDSLNVAVNQDNAGVPGTQIELVTVPADDISTQFARITVQFDNSTTSLAPATLYWLGFSRTGALDTENYYEIAVDEDLGYIGGSLKVHDGTAWQNRPTWADMPFRILGAEETTTQIETIVDQEGQFLTGHDVVDASGLSTNQYRDGRTTALVEMLDLLESGTTAGRRLLGTVTVDRVLHVEEEPAQPSGPDYYMDVDGKVTLAVGEQAIEEGSMAFVGQWVALRGLPPTADFSYVAAPSPVLMEAAEYDVAADRYIPHPAGTQAVWRAGTSIDEG